MHLMSNTHRQSVNWGTELMHILCSFDTHYECSKGQERPHGQLAVGKADLQSNHGHVVSSHTGKFGFQK